MSTTTLEASWVPDNESNEVNLDAKDDGRDEPVETGADT